MGRSLPREPELEDAHLQLVHLDPECLAVSRFYPLRPDPSAGVIGDFGLQLRHGTPGSPGRLDDAGQRRELPRDVARRAGEDQRDPAATDDDFLADDEGGLA